jgi:hypothetical protein
MGIFRYQVVWSGTARETGGKGDGIYSGGISGGNRKNNADGRYHNAVPENAVALENLKDLYALKRYVL